METIIEEGVEKKESENKWFVLRVLSGKERKIKDYLDIEIRRSGWGNVITQIMCPVEKVFKVVAGKKVMREKFFSRVIYFLKQLHHVYRMT